MDTQKIGAHSLLFANPPLLSYTGVVAGPKEGAGPLGADFDVVYEDNRLGEKSFERAERRMMEEACYIALGKGGLKTEDIDLFLAGDLLNQITVSGFSALAMQIPFFGLYGACSSFCESMALGSALLSGGYGERVLIATSSHNCSAERQFRYPTEYGFQRPGSAQWTVTGAAAAVLTAGGGEGLRITSATIGTVVDLGIKDTLNLGAAMAPAAASVLDLHFEELQRQPAYYDLILTGDLGQVGMQLMLELTDRRGHALRDRYNDCGTMLYYPHQKVEAGGSGCACSAIVTLGHILTLTNSGELDRVLVVATGALHSPTTSYQGENIPTIAYAVSLEK
ncbi:MAG: stage V sporulation protein AD [Firmicutes bacterium]|nr:stage V sporulation protein AD [Bacillota bacterium]